jgi:hypothetical protein
MAKRLSDSFPIVVGGGVVVVALFFHSIYEDLLKDIVLKRVSAFMGLPVAELVSRLTEMAVPIVGAVASIWIVLLFARREFRSVVPDPMVEAQRLHTAAILAQTEAWKANASTDVPAPNVAALNRQAPIDLGEDWQIAEHALEKFAAVPLINERNKWREMFEESYLAGHEAQDKITALQNAMGSLLGINDTQQMETSRRKLQLSAMQYDMAKGELKRSWDNLREDIEWKLAKGALMAKGFRSPHVSGNAEVAIFPAEWRVLTLNNAKSEALRKGSGEVLYSGLLIGKPGLL